MQLLIVLAVLTIVVFFVTAPLRRAVATSAPADASGHGRRIADLEAAREAKYREIRDAELDHQMGKLSDADFSAVERGLRAEAIEILDALDRAESQAPAATIEQP